VRCIDDVIVFFQANSDWVDGRGAKEEPDKGFEYIYKKDAEKWQPNAHDDNGDDDGADKGRNGGNQNDSQGEYHVDLASKNRDEL